MKVKASQRNDRKGSCEHNNKKEHRDKLEHINHEKTQFNQLYIFEDNKKAKRITEDFDIRQFELDEYKRLYGFGREEQNKKYIKQGQKSRCRTTEDIYKNAKTKPMESIFQFAKAEDNLDPKHQAQITLKAFYDTQKHLVSNFGDNYKPLDFSLHLDEKSAHLHGRATFGYMKNGYFVPNQTQALQAMGFDTSKKDRYENALINFTSYVREYFYTRCEVRAKELGLDITIDRNVEYPSKKHKNQLTYQVEELKKEVDKLTQELKELKELMTLEQSKNMTLELKNRQKQTQLDKKNKLIEQANDELSKIVEMTDNALNYITDATETIKVLEQANKRTNAVKRDLSRYNDFDEEIHHLGR